MTFKSFTLGICSALIFFGLVCGPVAAVIQPILFFNPDVVESNTGDDDTVVLMMDRAVRGLSGYGILICIDDPDIAEITSMNMPDWVGMKDVRRINSSACMIQGTDIGDMKNPGASEIVIADMEVHANAPGYAYITATPVTFDDDEKGRYQPSVVAGSIEITGAGPVPVIPMSS
jgi:hypothetical protein